MLHALYQSEWVCKACTYDVASAMICPMCSTPIDDKTVATLSSSTAEATKPVQVDAAAPEPVEDNKVAAADDKDKLREEKLQQMDDDAPQILLEPTPAPASSGRSSPHLSDVQVPPSDESDAGLEDIPVPVAALDEPKRPVSDEEQEAAAMEVGKRVMKHVFHKAGVDMDKAGKEAFLVVVVKVIKESNLLRLLMENEEDDVKRLATKRELATNLTKELVPFADEPLDDMEEEARQFLQVQSYAIEKKKKEELARRQEIARKKAEELRKAREAKLEERRARNKALQLQRDMEEKRRQSILEEQKELEERELAKKAEEERLRREEEERRAKKEAEEKAERLRLEQEARDAALAAQLQQNYSKQMKRRGRRVSQKMFSSHK